MVKGVKWLKHCGGEGRFSLGCCLTCFAALLLYLFFVHLPLQEACASYEGRRAELRGRLAAVMNFKNVHGDMAAYAKELSDREVRAQRVLPMSLGQGVFLQELQQKALQSQVKLQKVVPAETRTVDGVQQMPVSISCSGSYFAVLDFLRRMQQSERLLSIHETRIEQRTEAQSEVGALQCQLVVTAYAWPQSGAQDGMEGEKEMSRE
ncbi:type 4a pilus biogenesis protein PilO [Mitsuokella jalaludinii]|uniref:type 4a pilus biogenesis protein PilO n=1 Tax=Mitsuokella jalaludinii TaxID=187979 RepID=UPI00243046C6|nr:type 4a pilus biogenesis protein PilO [Mitsuokella jalaludinii]MCI7716346.1 type 4a pilus biogenesis protein PilO [Mitsuokella jalaludinii]MDD7745172.1 type 4a pilus biogenesis protein PilO [Mitsuokella jalaludinii]MDY5365393.1 type 4a pilus biogenesis protein PilO [Mitsuokella jalaludinii]